MRQFPLRFCVSYNFRVRRVIRVAFDGQDFQPNHRLQRVKLQPQLLKLLPQNPKSTMHTLIKTTCMLLTVALAWNQSSSLTSSAYASGPTDTSDFASANAVLNQYCTGCHNESDKEGGFSVASFGALMNGTPDGAVVKAGVPEESRILDLIDGKDEPHMPPEDEAQPTQAEIETLRKWIASGAKGPSATNRVAMLLARPRVPNLPAAKQQFVTAIAAAGDSTVATASLGSVTLSRRDDASVLWQLDSFAGKVNSLRLSADAKQLAVGSGVSGRAGQVSIVDVSTGRIKQQFMAHNDAIYCASLSPSGKMLATGSYDRQVMLWDVSGETPQPIHTFTGHNGAVYDLDFSPDGSVLATASADQTVKLWNTESLSRLDTLGQPEGEMRSVRITSDGRFVIAGGGDRQIRKWKLVSTSKPAINPMVYARFAHEKGITQLVLLGDRFFATGSEDQTVKIWNSDDLSIASAPVSLSDVPSGIASLGEDLCLVVELTGKQHIVSLDTAGIASSNYAKSNGAVNSESKRSVEVQPGRDEIQRESVSIQEREPNDNASKATAIELPAIVTGSIELASPGRGAEDFYRFNAKAGERWIFDVNAPKDSKVDSWIEVVDATGGSILRTRLQALRESYFTFRGKDSDTSDDFRMHKWEDMELDEYLYSSGEVTRLWLYPRGPDSGFKVYPGRGKRETFFDTTPVAHALGETAYVVRPLSAEEPPLPNGLPVFPIYFENDDDPLRRDGKDSRLKFIAPRSSTYVLRVRDARGFGGDDFQYEIDIRRPQPDFKISVVNTKLAMPINSGREWSVTATRLDGLDGAIEVQVDGLPDGFLATNPLIIEAGQTQAWGTIYATSAAVDAMRLQEVAKETAALGGDAKKETDSGKYKTMNLNLVASANVHGRTITHQLEQKLSLTLTDEKEETFKLVAAADPQQQIETLTIHPGQTITARLILNRNGKDGPISFGKDDAGRNLPHGCFVDNIGLNGLLIPGGQTEREFFITAAPKVKPGTRVFHLRIESSKSTSWPVLLRVVNPSRVVQN